MLLSFADSFVSMLCSVSGSDVLQGQFRVKAATLVSYDECGITFADRIVKRNHSQSALIKT